MKLFISFSALCEALKHKDFNESVLDLGLFFFGCSREHVFEDHNNDPIALCVLEAVKAAEVESRCVWRKRDLTSEDWGRLALLLTDNRLAITKRFVKISTTRSMALPSIREAVEGIIEVIG